MRKKRVMAKNNGNYIAVDTVPSVDWRVLPHLLVIVFKRGRLTIYWAEGIKSVRCFAESKEFMYFCHHK